MLALSKLREHPGGFIRVNLQLAGDFIGVEKTQSGSFEMGVVESRLSSAVWSGKSQDYGTIIEDLIQPFQRLRLKPWCLGFAARFHRFDALTG